MDPDPPHWLKAYRYILKELEPESEPVKKIPRAGAGQKQTVSATLAKKYEYRLELAELG